MTPDEHIDKDFFEAEKVINRVLENEDVTVESKLAIKEALCYLKMRMEIMLENTCLDGAFSE